MRSTESASNQESPDHEQGLHNDLLRHFGNPLDAIRKDDRHLNNLEPPHPGPVIHFDLEAVAIRFQGGKVDGLECAATPALESPGWIPDR